MAETAALSTTAAIKQYKSSNYVQKNVTLQNN